MTMQSLLPVSPANACSNIELTAERANFEAAMPAHYPRDRNMPDGSYNSPFLHCAWEGWLARAKASAKAAQVVIPKVVMDALDIGLDLAREEADEVHTIYAGYKPHRHAAVDRDVETIVLAIHAIRSYSPEKESK